MSFSDRLLLWLHIGFAIFTLGPVAAAMMATPRYIRRHDLAVLRYLYRTTGIFGVLTIGVFLFGLLLGRNEFDQAWLTVSMTLFVVSAALLALVFRDQRRAISAIAKMVAVTAAGEAGAHAASAAGAAQQRNAVSAGPAGTADRAEPDRPAAEAGRQDVSAPTGVTGGWPGEAATAAAAGTPGHVATVERGRIATMAGLISLIWLVILVLMVWHTHT